MLTLLTEWQKWHPICKHSASAWFPYYVAI